MYSPPPSVPTASSALVPWNASAARRSVRGMGRPAGVEESRKFSSRAKFQHRTSDSSGVVVASTPPPTHARCRMPAVPRTDTLARDSVVSRPSAAPHARCVVSRERVMTTRRAASGWYSSTSMAECRLLNASTASPPSLQ